MRQVPPNPVSAQLTAAPTTFFPLLIGRGKLAQHLHHYLHLIDFPHKHYDHSIHGPLDETALTADQLAELDRKLLACNAIWLLISDQAIEPVLKKIQARIEKLGAPLDRYHFLHSSAATQVAGMITFHPLMTFGKTFYSREQYEAIPFATFKGENSDEDAIPFPLPNPHFEIPAECRAFYHASAVMMSNLPILLWSAVSHEVGRITDAKVFDPILKQTLANFLEQRDQALTGPIVRNDAATIQKNLAAIETTPLYPLYQAFLAHAKQTRKETL